MKSVSTPDSAAVKGDSKIANGAAATGPEACKRPRGRPRAFDCEHALDAALHLFWKHGYEGTSLDDLTEAMGINRPSLYSAFGNKESLFRKVLDRYVSTTAKAMCDALSAPTAREVIERLWRGAAGGGCADGGRGCLLVQGGIAGSEESEPIRRELLVRRAASEDALRLRLERAVAERDLPKGTDTTALAKYVSTILHGIAVQAGGGAKREQLMAVVEIALRALPAAAPSKSKAQRRSKRSSSR